MKRFKVTFTDGSVFNQPRNDTSKLDPKRSAFYDVLQSGKEIKTFKVASLQVDLTTGLFKVGRKTVQLEDNILPIKKELIFFRQREQDATVSYKANEAGTMKAISVKPAGQRIKYFIGYEYKKGKQIKRIIMGVK